MVLCGYTYFPAQSHILIPVCHLLSLTILDKTLRFPCFLPVYRYCLIFSVIKLSFVALYKILRNKIDFSNQDMVKKYENIL